MRRKTAVVGLAVLVMLVGSVIASTAFTNASVDRDVNIDVVADDSAPLSLVDGNTGNVVYPATNGELTVDFANPSGSSGVNPDAVYELGDVSSPTTTYAFSVVNRDSQDHELTFDYAIATDPDTGSENVNFTVYDGSGARLGSATDENGGFTTGTISGGGTTLYVVVTVNSTGVTNASTLSGTLTVEDNSP